MAKVLFCQVQMMMKSCMMKTEEQQVLHLHPGLSHCQQMDVNIQQCSGIFMLEENMRSSINHDI